MEKFELLLIFFFHFARKHVFVPPNFGSLLFKTFSHNFAAIFSHNFCPSISAPISGVTQKPSQFLFEWNGFHVTLSFARMQIALIKIRAKI